MSRETRAIKRTENWLEAHGLTAAADLVRTLRKRVKREQSKRKFR